MPDEIKFSLMGPYRSTDGSWQFEMFILSGDHVLASGRVRARSRDNVMQLGHAIQMTGHELPPEILKP